MPSPINKIFRREDAVIILPVEKPQIPEHISTVANKYNLIEKPEYHISVLVAKNSLVVKEKIETEVAWKKLQEILNKLDWEYFPKNEYFLHQHFYTKEKMTELGFPETPAHTRRSIVQKVRMPDMDIFYKNLENLFDIPLAIPVPHITLFAWSDYEPCMTRGIGINSREDFDSYTRKKL